jgi:hypothetical protein
MPPEANVPNWRACAKETTIKIMQNKRNGEQVFTFKTDIKFSLSYIKEFWSRSQEALVRQNKTFDKPNVKQILCSH